MKNNLLSGDLCQKSTPNKQILRVMRILSLLLAGSLSVFAEVSYSQNARVNLNLTNVRMGKLQEEIEAQTDYLFLSNNTVDTSQRVTVKAKNETVASVLKNLFSSKNITYKMEGSHIVLKNKKKIKSYITSSQQSEKKITGTIVDASGEAIIGANILVKGTTNGTITDLDGHFVLAVSPDATLIITYIGYVTQEITTAGKSSFSLVLREDSEALDEVIVVGYGVQKKENLTGAVSTVKGDDLSLRPVTDATQSLQGLVPGLNVTNSNSGRPGASGSLTLRGQGNLANNAHPYILVDGVEMSLSDVNPSDIATISVLKDAAACSIYGARAAYGVILVTTKEGKDGKMRVNYQGTIGWNAPTAMPDMANAYDFAVYFNEGCKNAGVNQQYSDEKLALLNQYVKSPEGIDPWSELTNNNLVGAFENTAKGVGNVDYFKLHYKDAAFKQNHNLSLSGGGEKAKYYISTGLYKEDGILRYADMGFKRYNFNSNITSNLTKWLKLKVNAKFMHSNNQTPFGDGALREGFYHSLARFRPTVSDVDPNGHFTELTMIPYLQSGTKTETKNYNLTLTEGLEITPLKDWTIFMDYTYRMRNRQYDALNVAPMIPGADGETLYKGTRGELGVASNGKYTRIESSNNYQSINLYSNYSFSLDDDHHVVLMGGYQEEDYDYRYLKNTTVDLISTTNPGLDLGTGDKTVKDVRNGWATRGFFGRVNYNYKGKYLIEFNGRYDASSRFASDNRWGFFPSASVGWNVMHESFMESIASVLPIFKIRASYGRLGNQNSANLYTFASVMNITSLGRYYFGDGRQMSINGPGVVIPNTTWEKVDSQNIGIDFGLFGNALSGSFDLFRRDTKDMLGPSADLADMFGASVPRTNNACMRNTGWELSLQYRGRINKDISYSVGGMLSDAVSEVTSYENPTGTNPSGNWYVGKRVGEIWGYHASGLIQDQDEADAYNNDYDLSYISGIEWTPGDLKYTDLNGDKKIDNGNNTLDDMGDQVVIGNTTPRYLYSLNGAISWKGLSLSMIFQGVAKRDWSPTGNSVYFWGSGAYAQVTVFENHLDYWREDNKDAYYPKPYTAGAGSINTFRNKTSLRSSRYLQNAAYCRLKNLTLSYGVPEKWSKKIGLSKMQVFFSGENLFTISSLPDAFDPEALFTGNSYTSESGKNYPMNKVISFGLIVNL